MSYQLRAIRKLCQDACQRLMPFLSNQTDICQQSVRIMSDITL